MKNIFFVILFGFITQNSFSQEELSIEIGSKKIELNQFRSNDAKHLYYTIGKYYELKTKPNYLAEYEYLEDPDTGELISQIKIKKKNIIKYEHLIDTINIEALDHRNMAPFLIKSNDIETKIISFVITFLIDGKLKQFECYEWRAVSSLINVKENNITDIFISSIFVSTQNKQIEIRSRFRWKIKK